MTEMGKILEVAFASVWEEIKAKNGFGESVAFIERLFPDIEVRMEFVFATMGISSDQMKGIVHALHYLEKRIDGLQQTIATYDTALKAKMED